ncbi:hypothetical protein [Blastomonas aquatica]|nr:hypothetical protein [Blastomonas aquatica]
MAANKAQIIMSKAGMRDLARMSKGAQPLESTCRSEFDPAASLHQCRAAADYVELFAFPALHAVDDPKGTSAATRDFAVEFDIS